MNIEAEIVEGGKANIENCTEFQDPGRRSRLRERRNVLEVWPTHPGNLVMDAFASSTVMDEANAIAAAVRVRLALDTANNSPIAMRPTKTPLTLTPTIAGVRIFSRPWRRTEKRAISPRNELGQNEQRAD